jgi:hypothetical protein
MSTHLRAFRTAGEPAVARLCKLASNIGSYKSQRPVSPGPWREQNEQVAPAPKSGQ